MVEWLGHRTCNAEVVDSSHALTASWSCFSVAPSSTPHSLVNSQLACLLPAGIISNHVMLCYISNICFCLVYSIVPEKTLRERGLSNLYYIITEMRSHINYSLSCISDSKMRMRPTRLK